MPLLLLLLPHTHHESFANSYFCNFNLIDQFTICCLQLDCLRPRTSSSHKISPVQDRKVLMSHFSSTIISLFGLLINDLITVPKSYRTRFVFRLLLVAFLVQVAAGLERKTKSWINFHTGISHIASKHRGFIIPKAKTQRSKKKITNLKFIYLNLEMSKNAAPTAATVAANSTSISANDVENANRRSPSSPSRSDSAFWLTLNAHNFHSFLIDLRKKRFILICRQCDMTCRCWLLLTVLHAFITRA